MCKKYKKNIEKPATVRASSFICPWKERSEKAVAKVDLFGASTASWKMHKV